MNMIKRIFFLCAILLGSVGAGAELEVNSIPKGIEADKTKSNGESGDSNGPTVLIDCSKEGFRKNPAASFMYFVPLISPTLVESQISLNNRQEAGFTSYKRKLRSKSFYICCEFQMQGKGFQTNSFDPKEMININKESAEEGETLTNMLDYIKFDGEGYGRVEVKGRIAGSKETVTEVNVHFRNSIWQKSPVTIGLYSIKPVDGEYKYENRYNKLIARVDTLTFKRSETIPKMGITIASLHGDTKSNGIWGNIKGTIANFFIKPLKVSKLGNDTMLDFGYALLKEKRTFTFPKAENLKVESKAASARVQRH